MLARSMTATPAHKDPAAVAAPADDFKDSPADAGVFGSVAVNGSASGNLEINGDRDWFQVQLLAGARRYRHLLLK